MRQEHQLIFERYLQVLNELNIGPATIKMAMSKFKIDERQAKNLLAKYNKVETEFKKCGKDLFMFTTHEEALKYLPLFDAEAHQMAVDMSKRWLIKDDEIEFYRRGLLHLSQERSKSICNINVVKKFQKLINVAAARMGAAAAQSTLDAPLDFDDFNTDAVSADPLNMQLWPARLSKNIIDLMRPTDEMYAFKDPFKGVAKLLAHDANEVKVWITNNAAAVAEVKKEIQNYLTTKYNITPANTNPNGESAKYAFGDFCIEHTSNYEDYAHRNNAVATVYIVFNEKLLKKLIAIDEPLFAVTNLSVCVLHVYSDDSILLTPWSNNTQMKYDDAEQLVIALPIFKPFVSTFKPILKSRINVQLLSGKKFDNYSYEQKRAYISAYNGNNGKEITIQNFENLDTDLQQLYFMVRKPRAEYIFTTTDDGIELVNAPGAAKSDKEQMRNEVYNSFYAMLNPFKDSDVSYGATTAAYNEFVEERGQMINEAYQNILQKTKDQMQVNDYMTKFNKQIVAKLLWEHMCLFKVVKQIGEQDAAVKNTWTRVAAMHYNNDVNVCSYYNAMKKKAGA